MALSAIVGQVRFYEEGRTSADRAAETTWWRPSRLGFNLGNSSAALPPSLRLSKVSNTMMARWER